MFVRPGQDAYGLRWPIGDPAGMSHSGGTLCNRLPSGASVTDPIHGHGRELPWPPVGAGDAALTVADTPPAAVAREPVVPAVRFWREQRQLETGCRR